MGRNEQPTLALLHTINVKEAEANLLVEKQFLIVLHDGRDKLFKLELEAPLKPNLLLFLHFSLDCCFDLLLILQECNTRQLAVLVWLGEPQYQI